MDTRKLAQELDWHPAVTFRQGLTRTVAWYLENASWAAAVTSGRYREWIAFHYGAATVQAGP
jgi:dTDP-glucose 4,6-dehydratase